MGGDMTAHSTSETAGQAGALTSTAWNGVLSPHAFALACREIVTQHEGDRAHCELDALVTRLLFSLGYGEGMKVFLAHAAPAHTGAPA
jgi:hypothetical protein